MSNDFSSKIDKVLLLSYWNRLSQNSWNFQLKILVENMITISTEYTHSFMSFPSIALFCEKITRQRCPFNNMRHLGCKKVAWIPPIIHSILMKTGTKMIKWNSNLTVLLTRVYNSFFLLPKEITHSFYFLSTLSSQKLISNIFITSSLKYISHTTFWRKLITQSSLSLIILNSCCVNFCYGKITLAKKRGPIEEGIKLSYSDRTMMALYVDGTTIAYQEWQPSQVIQRLQMHVHRLVQYYVKWEIAIKAEKRVACSSKVSHG